MAGSFTLELMSVQPASVKAAVAAVQPVVLVSVVKVVVTSDQSADPRVVAFVLTSVPRSLAVARLQFIASALGAELAPFALSVPADVFL